MDSEDDFFEDSKEDTSSIDLSEFPNLERYFNHFEETDGVPEMQGCLPNLIIWIRLIVEPKDGDWIDPMSFFGLDDEDAEDFYSWGHNSRWKNVFWTFAQSNLKLVKEKCLELAKEHGDPSVEDYVGKANEKETSEK